MDDITSVLLPLLVLALLPPAIAYWRRLPEWTMARIWLWMKVPVAGWLVALGIAIQDAEEMARFRMPGSTGREGSK